MRYTKFLMFRGFRPQPGITLQQILSLAQSDRERELIRYTAFVSGQFSQTSARKILGLDDMKRRVAEIERCVSEAREIRKTIDDMAMIEIQSLAINHGLSSSEDESDFNSDAENTDTILTDEMVTMLTKLLRNSKCNWFEFLSPEVT